MVKNMDERQTQILKDCELFGEDEVRHKLYSGEYPGARDHLLVEGWLRDKESKREEELSATRDARDEATLKIAKEANSLARSTRNIAFIATIIAIIATIIAIIGIIK